MRLFVEVNLIFSALAFVTTAIGLSRKASGLDVVQLFLLVGWITWAGVLLFQ